MPVLILQNCPRVHIAISSDYIELHGLNLIDQVSRFLPAYVILALYVNARAQFSLSTWFGETLLLLLLFI